MQDDYEKQLKELREKMEMIKKQEIKRLIEEYQKKIEILRNKGGSEVERLRNEWEIETKNRID